MGKMWYTSRTFWGAIVYVASTFIRAKTGYVMSQEMEAVIFGALAIGLRHITKEPINWKKPVSS